MAVELDKDLVECGRQLLKHLNIPNVKIIHGDALDLPDNLETFDAIWPTLSVKTIPSSWVSRSIRPAYLAPLFQLQNTNLHPMNTYIKVTGIMLNTYNQLGGKRCDPGSGASDDARPAARLALAS